MNDKKQINTIENIIFLWQYLGKKRRVQFLFLFILMILSVFAEIASIGAVIPFLSVLTHPEMIMDLEWAQPLIHFFGINSKDELLLPVTVGFILIILLSTIIRILLLWANSYLSASMGVDLRKEVYKRTLYQPYEYHVSHNSSELISAVTEKVAMTILAAIIHVLLLFSSFLTSLAIIITLLVINTLVAIATFLVLGGGYILIGYFVKKQIQKNGEIISKNQPLAIKCMQEGLGGIRDIILDNSQEVFIKTYTKTAKNIQYSEMRNWLLGNLPKSFLEMLGITLIAILAYFLVTHGENKELVLPILGALALGAQRLLPSLQQIYFSWSLINGARSIINDVVIQIKKPLPHLLNRQISTNTIKFTNQILFKNINFKYNKTTTTILKDINLKIIKGTRVGFIGVTGSGKSTIFDIIMGLLKPTKGELVVDDTTICGKNIQNWQANIAHVPQSIFLSDATIAENIAFGIARDEINLERVKIVAKQASLDGFIKELPDKYNTHVGERGVQLSGGQRQRIGIARALYKKAKVIVFDEATSALDNETEKSVMQAINMLDQDLTILIIAHRLSTLQNCDLIYKLDNGNIIQSGTYEEILR